MSQRKHNNSRGIFKLHVNKSLKFKFKYIVK